MMRIDHLVVLLMYVFLDHVGDQSPPAMRHIPGIGDVPVGAAGGGGAADGGKPKKKRKRAAPKKKKKDDEFLASEFFSLVSFAKLCHFFQCFMMLAWFMFSYFDCCSYLLEIGDVPVGAATSGGAANADKPQKKRKHVAPKKKKEDDEFHVREFFFLVFCQHHVLFSLCF